MLPAVHLSIMSKKLEILKQSLAKKEQEQRTRFVRVFNQLCAVLNGR